MKFLPAGERKRVEETNTDKVDQVIDAVCGHVCDMIEKGINDTVVNETVQALAVLVSARAEWEKATDPYPFE